MIVHTILAQISCFAFYAFPSSKVPPNIALSFMHLIYSSPTVTVLSDVQASASPNEQMETHHHHIHIVR